MDWASPASLLAVALGYLLGSIPFGLVLTRLAGHGDVRAIGSGSIGATNVLRTGSKPLAALTLILDAAKGGFAIWLTRHFAPDAALLAGFAAVLGHNFPVWLGFKGGKGVATTLGALAIAAWPVGLLAALTWLLVAAIFRISSLASLVALAAAPIGAYWLSGMDIVIFAAALAVLAVVRHRANIDRLFKGTEPRIGARRGTDKVTPLTP